MSELNEALSLRETINRVWSTVAAKENMLTRQELMAISLVTRRLTRALRIIEEQKTNRKIWVNIESEAGIELKRLHKMIEGS